MSKNYVFTHYGPFDLFNNFVLPKEIQFTTYQFEKCPQTNKIHVQGYIQFKRKCRGITKLQKLLGSCHVETAKGTLEDNITYCNKPDTRLAGPFAYGTPMNQGHRTDLELFKESLKTGATDKELAEKHFGTYIKYHNSVPKLRKLLCNNNNRDSGYPLESFNVEPLELNKPQLLIGGTGIGKTEFALAHFKNPHLVRHLDDLMYLSKDHDGIVFDDMSFAHTNFSQVINLLDWEHDGAVHVRYQVACIPARTPRIFTYNDNSIFDIPNISDQQKQAIIRRYHCYACDNEKLY